MTARKRHRATITDAAREKLRADLVRRQDALDRQTHGPLCAPVGLTVTALAEKYGVSVAAVYREQRRMVGQ